MGSDVPAAPPPLVQNIDTDLTELPSSTEAPTGPLAETQRVKEKHTTRAPTTSRAQMKKLLVPSIKNSTAPMWNR